MLIDTRHLIAFGKGFAVTVPIDWVRQHGLVKGDRIIVVSDTDLRYVHPGSETASNVKDAVSRLAQAEV